MQIFLFSQSANSDSWRLKWFCQNNIVDTQSCISWYFFFIIPSCLSEIKMLSLAKNYHIFFILLLFPQGRGLEGKIPVAPHNRISVTTGRFCIVQHGSHKPHVATEHLNVTSVSEEMNFYLMLINLHSNNHICLGNIRLDSQL